MPPDADDTLDELRAAGVIAVLRGASARDALAVARVLVAVGVSALEITYTTPGATSVVKELAEDERVLLGAGTITCAREAEEAAGAGARFLVSPGSPPGLLEAMGDTGRPVIAGVLTPTEIMSVLERGAAAIKLFPAGALDPSYLLQLRGPFPAARFIPTGGVSAANAGPWLAAGAWAVGVGGALAPSRLTDGVDAVTVRHSARRLLAAVRSVRDVTARG